MTTKEDDGYIIIYRRWVTHPVTGRRIYPKKGKCIRIRIKVKR